jgi:hypothetical protein
MEFNQTNQNQGDVSNVMPPARSLTSDDLRNRFTHHPPKGDQAERYEKVRSSALSFANLLTENCPPSRELSLALTNLEQAVFWANASIARNE